MTIHSGVEHSTRNFHLERKQATMEDEWSVSYILRGMQDTSALMISGENFGRSLGRQLLSQLHDTESSLPVVNIGDGLGYNSRGILDVWRECGVRSPLIGLDLSPALLTAQKYRNPERASTHADALRLPFADSSLGGIVNNEMIADLPTFYAPEEDLYMYWYHGKRLLENQGIPDYALGYQTTEQLYGVLSNYFGSDRLGQTGLLDALSVAYQYNLQLPGFGNGAVSTHTIAAINTGAIHFVEEISRVLAPDRWAWVSEYGILNKNQWPLEADFGDHAEWSIQFAHIQTVAEQLGLAVQLIPMSQFVGIDEQAFCVVEQMPDGNVQALSPYEAVRYFPDEYADAQFMFPLQNRPLGVTYRDEQIASLRADGFNIHTIHPSKYLQSSWSGSGTSSRSMVYEHQLQQIGDIAKPFYAMLLRKL